MEVELNKVSYSYSKINFSSKEVLKDINMKFMVGNVTGIIGKNGSGKSTILEIIATILISTGEIKFDNVLLDENRIINNLLELQKVIGYSSQNPEEYFSNKTVQEELLNNLNYSNYDIEKKNKRLLDSLKMVNLYEEILERKVKNLSNGEKRKLSIAITLINNPKVIIFDCPTIGLDAYSKNELVKLIRLLKKRYRKTIIISTNDIDFLHKIVDYMYVIDNKEIVLEGTKYNVFKNSKLLKKYGITIPKVMDFSNTVLEKKNIKIGYRDEINDLIKDIYRYVK